MARFTYTKTVEYYNFTPPKSISEEEFKVYKTQINRNPNAPLMDEKAVQNSHEKLTTILIFGTIALIIECLACLLLILLNGGEFF